MSLPLSFPAHWLRPVMIALLCALLAACSGLAPAPSPAPARTHFSLPHEQQGDEMVVVAMGLLGTGYTFGGRNPEAGLDCSGMVSYVVEQVSGQHLPHNAAQIARITRPIRHSELRPGDLVFFNTSGKKHSHMGIYIGDRRFIHAPSSRGRVRVESLDSRYFRQRLDGVRSLIRAPGQRRF